MLSRVPLRVLLSAGISAVFLVAVGMTLLVSLLDQERTLLENTRGEMQLQVANISRMAERMLIKDPQLLEDSITQLATDRRAEVLAVIDVSGRVIFANNFAWRGHMAHEVIPGFSEQVFARLAGSSSVHVEYDTAYSRMVAMMSYREPSTGQQLRSFRKGGVYIKYNISDALGEARTKAVIQRLPEFAAMLIAALLVIMILNRQVSRPLAAVESAAHEIARGHYGVQLTPGGAQEVHGLTQAFNQMSTGLNTAVSRLDANSNYLQSILDNVIDGIITIDERGRIQSFNDAAEQIFGYRELEVIGQNVKMLMPQPYRSQHDEYIANYQRTGQARIIGAGREVTGKRSNGEEFPVDLAVSEIIHEGRRIYIGIVRDITERKRMDKMKSEFVSTVSHELRTPLTSISGSLGLLRGGALGPLSDEAQKMLEVAVANSERLTLLINDLLDMEKIAAGKITFDMQPHSLRELVAEAVEGSQGYALQHDVELKIIESMADYRVCIDRQRLLQVLNNYLSNAIKFSPTGGVVRIAAEKIDSSVRVCVSDDGPGIPLEFQARIFEKFSQADASDTRSKGGTGLGLAITKELIEHMSGAVGFTSVEGEGAVFYFDLPWL